VIDELCRVLRRETEAVIALETRLRALELIVAADEQRFVALALEEMEVASDRLAALELTRVLTLSTAGLPVDAVAGELVAGIVDPDERVAMRQVVARLATAMNRLEKARSRAELAVANGSRSARDQPEAGDAWARH